MVYLYFFGFVVGLIGAGNAVLLADAWINVGHGLNPYVAVPIAVLLAVYALFCGKQAIQIIDRM